MTKTKTNEIVKTAAQAELDRARKKYPNFVGNSPKALIAGHLAEQGLAEYVDAYLARLKETTGNPYRVRMWTELQARLAGKPVGKAKPKASAPAVEDDRIAILEAKFDRLMEVLLTK